MLTLGMSTFNLFNLYEVSFRAYIYLLLNVFSIIFGFCSYSNTQSFRTYDPQPFDFDQVLKSKHFWGIFLVVLVFGIITLRTQFGVLLMYTTGNIKVDPMGLLFQGSKLKYYFFNLFCTPFYYVCMALFSYCLLYERYRLKTILALLALVATYSFIGGGRVSVMFIVFYLLMFYFWGERINYSNSRIKPIRISLKTLLYSSALGVVLFFAMTFVTAMGQSGLSSNLDLKEAYNSLMKQFVVYSLGSFRAFDYALQHPGMYFGDYCYGRATFCGLDYLLSLVGGVVGMGFTPINYQTQSILQETSIPIGLDETFNYAYTNAMYSYYDLGVVGIIVIGFLMGRFYRWVIRLCYNTSSVSYLILSCFTFYILMHTVFSNYFNKNFTVPLIKVLIYYGKRKIVKRQ